MGGLLRSLGDYWARVEELLLCLLLVAMIVLACLQIALRGLFDMGFAWADPLLRYLVLWAGMVGAAAATRRKKHIAIDMASHLLPATVLPWARAVVSLFAAAVCGVLFYGAVLFLHDEASFGSRAILAIPSWMLYLFFPLAFGTMVIRFLARAVAELRRPASS